MTTRDDPRHPATVADVTPLSPNLRRIRFTVDAATGFTTGGEPDERVLIAFGAGAAGDDHRRSYSVRGWDPVRHLLDVDFAVHAGGAAAEWARSAAPGDPVHLSSAKGWWRPPPGARHLLLLADLTALPAAGRIVESLPAGVTARVVAEIPDDGDRQEWHTEADVTVTWLTSTDDGRSPGVLLDALIGLDGLDSVAYLWSCGETTTSRRIRAHLRRTLGWAPDRYHVMGYWQADKERWLARYARVQPRIEELAARELASGKTTDEVRDAIDDALAEADL
ncbi:siderophore-interacting protein [Rhodococcus sp. NPDC003322]